MKCPMNSVVFARLAALYSPATKKAIPQWTVTQANFTLYPLSQNVPTRVRAQPPEEVQ